MTITQNGDVVNYSKAGTLRTAEMVVAAPTGFTGTATFTPAAASHTAGDVNGGAQEIVFTPTPPTGARLRIVSGTLQIQWRDHRDHGVEAAPAQRHATLGIGR